MQNYFNKKVRFFVLTLFIMLLSTGCWNRKELSELGIVGVAAIDVEEEARVKLTFEVIKPKRIESKGGDVEPATYFESEGQSLFEASRNATIKFKQRLYWPHANAYFFNEKAGKLGLIKYLDYLNRDHEARRYVHMAISKGVPACSLIGLKGSKEEVSSIYMEALFDNYIANGKGVSTKLIDFIKVYYAEGIEPVVGIVQKVKKTNTEFLASQNEDDEFMPSIEGAAVFREDELVGFLDGIQARAYNVVTNKIKSGIIVSASPDKVGINSVEIIKASSKMEVKKNEDKYKLLVKIEINGMVGEETGKGDMSSVESLKKIEQNTSDVLKGEIAETIKIAQKFNSDIFGFGQVIHRKYPKEWKKIKNRWNEIFTSQVVEVEVKTEVQRVGGATKPLYEKGS